MVVHVDAMDAALIQNKLYVNKWYAKPTDLEQNHDLCGK